MTTKKETKGRNSTPEATVKEEDKLEIVKEKIYDLDYNDNLFNKLYEKLGVDCDNIEDIKNSVERFFEEIVENMEHIQDELIKVGVLALTPEQDHIRRLINDKTSTIEIRKEQLKNPSYDNIHDHIKQRIVEATIDRSVLGIRYLNTFKYGYKLVNKAGVVRNKFLFYL